MISIEKPCVVELTEKFMEKHDIKYRWVKVKGNEEYRSHFFIHQKEVYDAVLQISGMAMLTRVRGDVFRLYYPMICNPIVRDILITKYGYADKDGQDEFGNH